MTTRRRQSMEEDGHPSDGTLPPVVQKWLEPRLGAKVHQGMSVETAWDELIKDILLESLSTATLEELAAVLTAVAQLDSADRLDLIWRILRITPDPDCASQRDVERIRDMLIEEYPPLSDDVARRSATSREFDALFERIDAGLSSDWDPAWDAIERFLSWCDRRYDPVSGCFFIFPRFPEMKDMYIEPIEAKSLAILFRMLQQGLKQKGKNIFDVFDFTYPEEHKEFFEEMVDAVFPNGLPEDPTLVQQQTFNAKSGGHFSLRRRTFKQVAGQMKPRWLNQQHILFETLRGADNQMMLRHELIREALAKDEDWSQRSGLPTTFTGKTPRNSASACLTTNQDKYFVQLPATNGDVYIALAFKPNDLDDAIVKYNKWVKNLTGYDWKLCFGKPRRNKANIDLIRNQPALVMHTGTPISNVWHCRNCFKGVCDAQLPRCGRCRKLNMLCIYPRKPDTRDVTKPKSTELSGADYDNSEDDSAVYRKPVSTRSKKVSNKGVEVLEPYEEPLELPDGIDQILDISNVPAILDDIVEVRPSQIPRAGRGLFAKRNLPASTPLGFYFGVPMMENEFDKLKDGKGRSSHYSMRYRHTILDATNDNGEPFDNPEGKIFCHFHFMNEDPFGNMVFLEGSEVNQVICWTKREIQKNEELFVYYGHEVDRSDWTTVQSEEEEEDESNSDDMDIDDAYGGNRRGRRMSKRLAEKHGHMRALGSRMTVADEPEPDPVDEYDMYHPFTKVDPDERSWPPTFNQLARRRPSRMSDDDDDDENEDEDEDDDGEEEDEEGEGEEEDKDEDADLNFYGEGEDGGFVMTDDENALDVADDMSVKSESE